MRGFKEYLEALNFNRRPINQDRFVSRLKPSRSALENHPFVKDATFGIEIEFITALIPFQDMKPQWIALALNDTDFEEEFVNIYSKNDIDYEKNEDDFINYIRMNKKRAYDKILELIENREFNPDKYDNAYHQTLISYWSKKFIEIIKRNYKVYEGRESSGKYWAVGDDGHDSEFNLPVLEIRSGILSQKDFPKLIETLNSISNFVKANQECLWARGNTGLHVHVHNSNTGNKNGYTDMFSRLASASYVDEDAIWDASSSHDRSFEKYARLNNPQNFEGYGKRGVHDDIVFQLMKLNKGKQKEITVDNSYFERFMSVLSRNSGVNVTSEHPTVEYRYLSSALIETPQKVIDFIKYFIDHTAQMSNKERISFENDTHRIVLTKMPEDKIKINYFTKKDHEVEWEDETGRSLPSTYKYPKIPKSGYPRENLDDTNISTNQQRSLKEPFSQWFKTLPSSKQTELKNKIIKNI